MNLLELLAGISYTGTAQNKQVNTITCDSRQVMEGSVFCCIPGLKFDGHDHAQIAVDKGAVAVICQRDVGVDSQIIVEDTRHAYSIICGNFFNNPAKKLKLLGITGTNGKTTITYLMKHILEQAGKVVGLIGTIQNEIGDMVIPAKHTTPDPLALHTMLARMVQAGCEYVVMEVSSHAMDQFRVAGCRFSSATFTNLTQDHLDYHKDMQSYFEAKRKLFDQCDTAVINLDDTFGRRLAKELTCKTLTFSCESDVADYTAHNIKFSAKGSTFTLLSSQGLARVSFCMPGKFSVSNALAAMVGCIAVGIPLDSAVNGITTSSGVAGRIEILPTNTPYTIIRDYAHSPDGLEKVLETLREFAPAKIVTLFGCAGNRDRNKRPKMAEVVARLSDFCILTSDNPRDEDPQQIIADALPGFQAHKTPYKTITDRYEAISWALDFCGEQDILLLAGKGHEDYQVLEYGTIYFDEKEIVTKLLLEKQKGKEGEGSAKA